MSERANIGSPPANKTVAMHPADTTPAYFTSHSTAHIGVLHSARAESPTR